MWAKTAKRKLALDPMIRRMITKAIQRRNGRRSRLTLKPPSENHGILFGTDFSESARRAQFAAAALAKRLDQPMTLLHSIEFPDVSADSYDRALKWLTANRRKDLLKEAEALREKGTEVEAIIVTGQPDEALVNTSKVDNPFLLVVSSAGRRGIDRWLLGSVAERAAERAPVPTLVIRDPAPWIEWAEGTRPLRVFVCFNRTSTSEIALRWVKQLSAIGPCEVTVGWVNWPAEEWTRLGSNGSLSLISNPPDVQRALERDLGARTEELLGAAPRRVRVEANWGRVEWRLAEMAREEKADLIVVGSHQYQGFERLWHSSISRALLHQAPMSVAVVPHVSGKPRQANVAPPLRRVLVATDFSELANAAIPRAYSLLRGGGTVHLLHVLPRLGELPDGFAARLETVRDKTPDSQRMMECAARLRALSPVDAETQGIMTQIQVVEGRDVAEVICQNAERLNVELICLGSRGRTGLSGTFMGSVAQEVIARSRRPLLIVPPQIA